MKVYTEGAVVQCRSGNMTIEMSTPYLAHSVNLWIFFLNDMELQMFDILLPAVVFFYVNARYKILNYHPMME